MNEILCGKTVIIVEDEYLSVLALSDMVAYLGCEVVGHATNLGQALDLTDNAAFDIALLDIHLDGETSYPVAQQLLSREVPFLFTTGLADMGPDWCRDSLRILKPFSKTSLERMMMASLTPRPQDMRAD